MKPEFSMKEKVLAPLLVFLEKIYGVMFILPPPDVRNKRAPYFEKIQDPKKGRRIEQNDSYITYVVVRNALIASTALAVFLFIVALLNPDVLFSLQNYVAGKSVLMLIGADMLAQHSIVIAYSYSFSFLMGSATSILLPFYLLIFFINVDLKKVDILRNYAPYKHKKSRTLKRKIKAILLFYLVRESGFYAFGGLPPAFISWLITYRIFLICITRIFICS